MQIKKPLFWDHYKPTFLSNILLPLTFLMEIMNFILNRKKKLRYDKIFTICIGNIYLGGTGKTPTVISLFRLLKKINLNISTAKKFYSNQNDEHILLKRKTNFLLGRTRKSIIENAIKNKRKVLLFDDGLQDKRIDYDLKFVCFDHDTWIGNGRLIPSGPMREKLESLQKYDAVFIKSINKNISSKKSIIKKINPRIKIFLTHFKLLNINKFNKKKNYLIFSGIGNSLNFKKILIKNKFKIIKEIIFPDHYIYSDIDMYRIIDLSRKLNAKIITTEKDYVKINNKFKKIIKFLKIDLDINNKNELLNFVKKKIYEKY